MGWGARLLGGGGVAVAFLSKKMHHQPHFLNSFLQYTTKKTTSATLYDHIDKTKFDFLMKALMEFYMKTRKYKGSETPLTPYPTPPE